MVAITALMLMLVQGGSLSHTMLVYLSGAIVLCNAVGFGLARKQYAGADVAAGFCGVTIASLLVGSFGGAVISAVMTGVSAFLPTYVQGAMGRSALTGGLVLGAMSVTWAVASFYGGRLMVRTTYRLTAVLGTLALIAGSAVLIALTPERGVVWASRRIAADRLRHGAVQHHVHRFDPGGRAVAPARRRHVVMPGPALRLARRWGAASFGAVLNLTLLLEAPDAVSKVDRLLDPMQRSGLDLPELTRLTEVVGAGAAQHLRPGRAACRWWRWGWRCCCRRGSVRRGRHEDESPGSPLAGL